MRLFRGLLRLVGGYKIYEKVLEREIKEGTIPNHVAFILDGNRRWARLQGMPSWAGYKEGARKVDEVLSWCLDLNVKTVTLFVLSTENITRRPRDELKKLYEVMEENLKEKIGDERIHENRVRVKAIGNVDLLPENIKQLLRKLEYATKEYGDHYLNIAIAYGGRHEIVEAAKRLARDALEGKITLENVDEELFKGYLYTSHLPNPYPDLIIRTSGEFRISNFLLWQSAYSEVVVIDVYWPEFRKIDLLRAIRTYQRRNRRFGG